MSENKTISFIIPTIGRPSLQKTIESVEQWPGDELIVINHNPPSGNWGNAERQEGTDKAKCDYLAFIDDDDVYVPGVREIMDRAIRNSSGDTPILFRMKYPSGRVLWRNKRVKNGNVGAPMILVPNIKEKLAEWDQKYSWADFYFINRWKWFHEEINWVDEVTVLLGHNDEKFEENLSHAELAEVQRKRWNLYD